MDKPFFDKPPLTYDVQIQLLKSRGLSIQNEDKALHILQVISYYRLSGYWYPLLEDKENHKFKKNAEFETAFNLYKFDREFRLLFLNFI
jgi:abortive infection bacteriophage resistance protein